MLLPVWVNGTGPDEPLFWYLVILIIFSPVFSPLCFSPPLSPIFELYYLVAFIVSFPQGPERTTANVCSSSKSIIVSCHLCNCKDISVTAPKQCFLKKGYWLSLFLHSVTFTWHCMWTEPLVNCSPLHKVSVHGHLSEEKALWESAVLHRRKWDPFSPPCICYDKLSVSIFRWLLFKDWSSIRMSSALTKSTAGMDDSGWFSLLYILLLNLLFSIWVVGAFVS